MDLRFSDEDLRFRDEVRAFIAEAFDQPLREKLAQSKNGYLDKESQRTWQKRLHARGWVAPNWPKAHGGPGFTPAQKYLFDVEMTAAGVPQVIPMGLKMVAPVLIAFGTDTQKAQHLPPILTSELFWCQGYSEPGAGSDLASLQTRCEDKGDHYLVNGSKIWTTHAQWADWMFCLVRTRTTPKPQDGISFILIDMTSPGITVRPLITLDVPVDGQQEVNQVFFEDVRVPKENRIGEENKGWTYAKYLLEFERGNAYGPGLRRALNKVREMARKAPRDGMDLYGESAFRRRIDALDVQISAMEMTELRIFSAMSTGTPPGPESSMLKCRGTELQQAVSELAIEALGIYASPFVHNTFERINVPRPGPDDAAPVSAYYFNLRKASIYAGSNEIQRNIIAKQVLGL